MTSLQTQIILYLAKSKPQNISEIKKGIQGHYKSIWHAFKSLKEQHMVKKVTSKKYHGVNYPRYWLTEQSVIFALHKGINPDPLFRQVLEFYPKNKDLQFLTEIATFFGKEMASEFYRANLADQTNITSSLIAPLIKYIRPIKTAVSELMWELSQKELTEFRTVLEKYPEQYRSLIQELEQAAENLRRLSELLQHRQPKRIFDELKES